MITINKQYQLQVDRYNFPTNCIDCGSKLLSHNSGHDPEIISSLCLNCGTLITVEFSQREYSNTDLESLNEERNESGLWKIKSFAKRYFEN